MNREVTLKNHSEREGEVFDFFKEVMEESNQIFLNEENGKNRIPLRIQTIIAFSTIDVLASYWFEYQGITGKTNERGQVWFDHFCLTEKNKFFKDSLKDISSKRLYEFRNALVHFFGLGKMEEGQFHIALAANDFADADRKNMEEVFLKKKHKTIFIQPKVFYDLIREGALLMLLYWQNVIQDAQNNFSKEKEYIDGIQRVWQKIRSEGAKGISREKFFGK